MKSIIFISLITIFLSKILEQDVTEKEYFLNVAKIVEDYLSKKKAEKPTFMIEEALNYAQIQIDTSSTEKIDDAFIERYKLPKSMRSVFQEIYIDKDSDEVYQKMEGMKKILSPLDEITIYYLIHNHYRYKGKDKKIVCSVFTNAKFKLEPKFDVTNKTICNKGFMIESCKTFEIVEYHSYLNDKDLTAMNEFIVSKTQEMYVKFLRDQYS